MLRSRRNSDLIDSVFDDAFIRRSPERYIQKNDVCFARIIISAIHQSATFHHSSSKDNIQYWKTIRMKLTRVLGWSLGRRTNGRASNDTVKRVRSTFPANWYWNVRFEKYFFIKIDFSILYFSSSSILRLSSLLSSVHFFFLLSFFHFFSDSEQIKKIKKTSILRLKKFIHVSCSTR